MRDFVKSQRIKSRIARYTITEDNKVTLKSYKFVNLSHSKYSQASSRNEDKIQSNNVTTSTNKPKTKSTMSNYYKK
jgi:hypothetical protein